MSKLLQSIFQHSRQKFDVPFSGILTHQSYPPYLATKLYLIVHDDILVYLASSRA